MKNLTIARKLTLIIGVTILWGAGMGGLLLAHLQDLSSSYEQLLAHDVADVDAARVIQVGFKKQVQEWKDILLRGSDPTALAKYRDAFFSSEADVESRAEKLQATTGDTKAAAELAAFVTAHRQMTEKYRAALQAFVQSPDKDPRPADKMVKGQDRAPTDLIDGVVARLNERITAFKAEQAVSVSRQRTRTIFISVVVLAVVLALASLIARGITRAQADIIRGLEAMAAGDLGQRLDDTRRDEMGRIVVALNAAMEAARAAQEAASAAAMERERAQSETLRLGFEKVLQSIIAAHSGDLTAEIAVDGESDAIVREVGATLSALLENLRSRIATIDSHAGQLSAASEELSATAHQMTGASRETASEVLSAKAVAEDMGKTAQSVSMSAEQMNAAISEITQSAQQARRVAQEAVTLVEGATRTVSALGDSSNEIGKVVKVITVIAEQTNLLALNATIEAARAGEAGKGFAVVAHEVKELAKETSQATDEISGKIQAIQSDARRAVDAILAIRAVIDNVNTLSGTIAAAVEEQTAATGEMRKTFQVVADGTSKVIGNVTTVNQAANATAGGARDTQSAADAIATMAVQLKELVSQFKYKTTEAPAYLATAAGRAPNGARAQRAA